MICDPDRYYRTEEIVRFLLRTPLSIGALQMRSNLTIRKIFSTTLRDTVPPLVAIPFHRGGRKIACQAMATSELHLALASGPCRTAIR